MPCTTQAQKNAAFLRFSTQPLTGYPGTRVTVFEPPNFCSKSNEPCSKSSPPCSVRTVSAVTPKPPVKRSLSGNETREFTASVNLSTEILVWPNHARGVQCMLSLSVSYVDLPPIDPLLSRGYHRHLPAKKHPQNL